MNAETTKMMQDALDAAVTRLNNGSGTAEPPVSRPDPIAALMTVLPRLLHHDDSRDDLLEKVEALRKDDLTPLRDQVQVLRKQCRRILKSQARMLARVAEMQQQYTTVAGAVLELAQQMERITLVEDIPAGEEEDDDYGGEPPPASGGYRRADSRGSRSAYGSPHRNR